MEAGRMTFIGYIVAVLVGAALGAFASVIGARSRGTSLMGSAKRDAQQLLSDAERESAGILKEGRTQVKELEVNLRAEMERESREMRKEVAALEKRILSKEENVDKRAESLDKTTAELAKQERDLVAKEKDHEKAMERLAQLHQEQAAKLEAISGLTADQARRELFILLENEVKRDSALHLKRVED